MLLKRICNGHLVGTCNFMIGLRPCSLMIFVDYEKLSPSPCQLACLFTMNTKLHEYTIAVQWQAAQVIWSLDGGLANLGMVVVLNKEIGCNFLLV